MSHSVPRIARRLLVGGMGGLLIVAMAVPASAEPSISAAHTLPPDVGGNYNNASPYQSVWCSDAADCVFAGPSEVESNGTATVLTESAGVFGTPAAVTLPANATTAANGGFSYLLDVTCWSVGNCAAVGSYGVTFGSGDSAEVDALPMVADEISGSWQTAQEITLPTSAPLQQGQLSGVSCDSEGDCTAVGYYIDVNTATLSITPHLIATTQAMSVTTWTEGALLPDVPGAPDIELSTAVSCTAASTCTTIAYGASLTEGTFVGEYLSEEAGTWSSAGAVGSLGGSPVLFDDLSCPSAGNCVAVGSSGGFTTDPAIDVETTGTWASPKAVALPFLGPLTDSGELVSVSCLSVTQCVAVGSANYGDIDQYSAGLVASTTGSGWSSTLDSASITIKSAPATVVELAAVQCFTLSDCLVVGAAGAGSSFSTTHTAAFWSTASASEPLRPAGKPSGLVIKPGPAVTKVSFQPPSSDGGSKILYFTVTAKSKGEKTRTCVTPGLSCTFRGAVKGKVYSVTVATHTKAGVSLPSPAKTFIAK